MTEMNSVWQDTAARYYPEVEAYLEAHRRTYRPNQREDLYDQLVTALIDTARAYPDSGQFPALLKEAFHKAHRRYFVSAVKDAGRLISLSDPSLRSWMEEMAA